MPAVLAVAHLDRLGGQLALPKQDNIWDAVVVRISQSLFQVGVGLVAKLSPDVPGPQLGTDLHALGLQVLSYGHHQHLQSKSCRLSQTPKATSCLVIDNPFMSMFFAGKALLCLATGGGIRYTGAAKLTACLERGVMDLYCRC